MFLCYLSKVHVGLLMQTGEAVPALAAIKKWPLIQGRR